jgi:hypothetical protein
MKFKVGDRVRFKGPVASNQHIIGHEGIITKIAPDLHYPIYVKWDNHKYHNCYRESDLELVDEPIIDVDDLFAEIEI